MIPVNNKILVRVDMSQKNTIEVGGIKVSTALLFETNYREKSPVIAVVVKGNEILKKDDIICCHHNHYYHPSPYHVQEDLFSIPFNRTIFGVFDKNGVLNPVCGNVLGEKVYEKTLLLLPPEKMVHYKDRVIITNGGNTQYKENDLVFTRPSAPYDIVYNWNNTEFRVTKVDSQMIVGVVKGYNKQKFSFVS
jgi:hypothetical protein